MQDESSAQAIAARLKSLRSYFDLPQRQFCERIGIKKPTYNDWEQGLRDPSVDGVIAIFKAFDVSIYWLLFGPGDAPKFREQTPTELDVVRGVAQAAYEAKKMLKGDAMAEVVGHILEARGKTRQERLDAAMMFLRH
jgi:transcriptional regulator with XRE-family HTH domain